MTAMGWLIALVALALPTLAVFGRLLWDLRQERQADRALRADVERPSELADHWDAREYIVGIRFPGGHRWETGWFTWPAVSEWAARASLEPDTVAYIHEPDRQAPGYLTAWEWTRGELTTHAYCREEDPTS